MTAQVKKPKARYKTKKDKLLPTIIALDANNLTAPQIAEQTGVNRTTIWKWLKELQKENIEYQSLKKNLADQLAKAALDNINLSNRITEYFTLLPEEEFKQITINNLAIIKRACDVAAGIHHEHYRLESGQSTENIAIEHLVIRSEDLLKRLNYDKGNT